MAAIYLPISFVGKYPYT